jgi:hypothetical protein
LTQADRNKPVDEIEPLTEDDMVLAWAEAERESPRYRDAWIQMGLGAVPLSAGVCRAVLEQLRGFPDRMIFDGLPRPMEWSLVKVTIEELGDFRYLNYPTFAALSEGSRLIRDGAANVEHVQVGENLNERVQQTESSLAAGQVHEPLIAVTAPNQPTPIIIEGNTRATAYIRFHPPHETIDLILGAADDLSKWAFV